MLVVQMPLVGAEWAVKPHCMIKACHLYATLVPTEAMWQ
jgi:hypothetical protein